AWRAGEREARLIATTGTRGIPDGWQVSEGGTVGFSPNGQRLFFGPAPPPTPAPAGSGEPAEVQVDIAHGRDQLVPPQQLLQANQGRRRHFLAVAHLRATRVVQLADETLPQLTLGARGDANYAVGADSRPYAIENNWDTPARADHYLVDLRTG